MRDENKQINTGHGALQIHGNHNTVNHNQHTHHHQHDHHHTHFEAPAFALQAPPAPPAHYRQRGRPAADITPAQKALLALMRPLSKPVRAQVLVYMRIEFGTGLVVELDPGEVQRVRRVVLDARREAGI